MGGGGTHHCSWKVSPNILPSTVIDALPSGPREFAMDSTKLFCQLTNKASHAWQ